MRWPLVREPLMLETSMPGVFAAGATRSGSVKRVAPAFRRRYFFSLGGLIMMCAPAVPGYINQGAVPGVIDRPVDSGVA